MTIFQIIKITKLSPAFLIRSGLIGATVNQTCHYITIGSYVNNVCTVPLGLESL